MINRRNFLRRSALGLTALAASQEVGELFANPYGKPVGLQLYTLRDDLQKDMLGTLKQVAAIGIKDGERNISNKISRGTFTAVWFVQCMEAIGVKTIHLEDE